MLTGRRPVPIPTGYAPGSASFLFSSSIGPRLVLEAPDMARGAVVEHKTIGQQVVEAEGFKAWRDAKGKEAFSVRLSEPPTEAKVMTLAGGTTQGGGGSPSSSLVVADRRDFVRLPERKLLIRDLLGPAPTTSNNIEFPVEASFTNNADMVGEGALKPESAIGFDLKSNPVRTIAHFMRASRQMMDDGPAMAAYIDRRLEYGVNLKEEQQLLYGTGAGQQLVGLSLLATPLSTTGFQIINLFDSVLAAIAQVELSLHDADGIVMHPFDWRRMQMLKTAYGDYYGGGPFGQRVTDLLWELPKVTSHAMKRGDFMVGSFKLAAQMFERDRLQVVLSTEDQDNFVRNLVTIRGEKRIALAIYKPEAMVYGTFPTTT